MVIMLQGASARMVWTSALAKRFVSVISLQIDRSEEDGISYFESESFKRRSNDYHKIARSLDGFCQVAYPLSFLLFLMIYYFIVIAGNQSGCINDNSR